MNYQPFGALLQSRAVFDAAGSDNGRLDQAIGVIVQRLLRTGADCLDKTFFPLRCLQMTDTRPLAFSNRLMRTVLNEAEAAARVRLPGIESCEQPHDSPGRLTRVAKANQPIS